MENKAARDKRWKYLRDTGRPSLVVDPEELEAVFLHLEDLLARGMSLRQIGDQVGVPLQSVRHVARRNTVKGIRRANWEKLMTARYVDPESAEGWGAHMDPSGTVRRLQGLWADGFGGGFLAEHAGISRTTVKRILHAERGIVHGVYAKRVADLYDSLDGKTPEDFGLNGQGVAHCKSRAAALGYAPRHCWDWDTIDDPDAQPEWTGACGTEQGYQIHYRERGRLYWAEDLQRKVTACGPCRIAHQVYKNTPREKMEGPTEYVAKAPNRQWSHCGQGHELVGENLYIRPDGGGRMCRICVKRRRDAKKSPSNGSGEAAR